LASRHEATRNSKTLTPLRARELKKSPQNLIKYITTSVTRYKKEIPFHNHLISINRQFRKKKMSFAPNPGRGHPEIVRKKPTSESLFIPNQMEETARLENLEKMVHFHWIIAYSEEELLRLLSWAAVTKLMWGVHNPCWRFATHLIPHICHVCFCLRF
jgi:hypothetical protein